MHTHAHAHTHSYTCTLMHMHVNTRAHTHLYIYTLIHTSCTYTLMHVHVHTRAHTHSYTHVYTRTHTRTRTHAHTHTHTHTRTHAHTHTHTHTRGTPAAAALEWKGCGLSSPTSLPCSLKGRMDFSFSSLFLHFSCFSRLTAALRLNEQRLGSDRTNSQNCALMTFALIIGANLVFKACRNAGFSVFL